MINMLYILIFFSAGSVSSAKNLAICSTREEIQLEMSLIASNIANVHTTRTPEGGPYQRQSLFCDGHYCEIVSSQVSLVKYEPGHLDADDNGYVKYPDIDLMDELSAMIAAIQAYEAQDGNCNSSSQF